MEDPIGYSAWQDPSLSATGQSPGEPFHPGLMGSYLLYCLAAVIFPFKESSCGCSKDSPEPDLLIAPFNRYISQWASF